MATDGPPGQKESTVVHERNCAIEATRRTMNLQRTANSVLTVCLTLGGRPMRNAEWRIAGSMHRPERK
jgi:hypothetical protein